MTNFQVAIPSAGRPTRLAQATLPLLLDGGVTPDQITVYVPDEDAATDYQRTLPSSIFIQYGHGLGMREARNAIAHAYLPGTRLVQVDDDITGFLRLTIDHQLEPLGSNLATYFDACFNLADDHLWCWYPVANAFFMHDQVRRGKLWYAVGALFGYTVQGDDAELVFVDDKEDFERSIRFYLRDGEVVRFDYLTFNTRYYGEPGGMQLYRTPATIEAGARAVAASYPDHAKFYRKKNGRAEIKLRG